MKRSLTSFTFGHSDKFMDKSSQAKVILSNALRCAVHARKRLALFVRFQATPLTADRRWYAKSYRARPRMPLGPCSFRDVLHTYISFRGVLHTPPVSTLCSNVRIGLRLFRLAICRSAASDSNVLPPRTHSVRCTIAHWPSAK
jgi:hypothetical protein